jgi:molybdopterin synthase catalytic subunit/molybdopterin converting factor small subunit
MRVRVLYFGMLRDAIGRQIDNINLAEGATLSDLIAECRRVAPPVEDFQKILAFSVNQEYAQLSTRLNDGDEVALLPPVSGGANAETATKFQSGKRCRITRDKIDQQQIMDEIKHAEDGAVSVFDGIVRDHSRGRKTLYLDYQAYEEMALKQMEELAESALANYKIRDVRMVHRLGRLEISESSIFIAVAAAHRAPAMDACRWLIDTLKKTVPIWKKEYFEDGAVWADGEPFPEEVRVGSGTSGLQPQRSK